MHMKLIISGKNIEVTDALRERTIKKMSRLERFFSSETEAHITLSVEKIRHIVEVTIPYKGMIFRAEVVNDDMYASLDKAIDILERQIKKNKTRLEKRLREGAFIPAEAPKNLSPVTEEDVEEESEFKIVRSKKFAIKPMDVEEAILQMNLLGHEFFVFTNADTNLVNVVYRRKDGNYGLIEPEY